MLRSISILFLSPNKREGIIENVRKLSQAITVEINIMKYADVMSFARVHTSDLRVPEASVLEHPLRGEGTTTT